VLALDPGYVSRFQREARLAARLSHPHLVSIFDFSAHGTRPYLVLEYIAGGTLADRLRTVPSPEWDPVVLARELLDAVGYIHQAGIIHRDIKPANVLIGDDGRARLTDFGIAQPSDATRLTRTGLVIGTQRYISPEVLAGHPADERSDLFACGVLLGECLKAGAARELADLVGQLTDPDPGRRPPSARKAIAMLEPPATASTRVLRRSASTAPTRVPPTAARDNCGGRPASPP
jgi:serine/threonine protein kinase